MQGGNFPQQLYQQNKLSHLCLRNSQRRRLGPYFTEQVLSPRSKAVSACSLRATYGCWMVRGTKYPWMRKINDASWSIVIFINSVSWLTVCTLYQLSPDWSFVLYQFCLLADRLYSLSIVSWLIICTLSILSAGWSFVLFIICLLNDDLYSLSILPPGWSIVLLINFVSWLIICTLFQLCLLDDRL